MASRTEGCCDSNNSTEAAIPPSSKGRFAGVSNTAETSAALTLMLPELPKNIDFETFRKTDDTWKKIVEWHNGKGSRTSSQDECHQKERFVLQDWPRNPDGPTMPKSNRGKNTGNGCLMWGATLYDFYLVPRVPCVPTFLTFSTGSRIAAWMREVGELDWAKDHLARADMEDEPRQIEVFDIGKYIEWLEIQVWKGKVGKPMSVDRSGKQEGNQCLYAPSNYPEPWPLRPFSAPLARLQRKFSHSSLPRRLIVHDPWNVLAVNNPERRGIYPRTCKWGSKPDIIRVYHLQLNKETSEKQNPQAGGLPPEDFQGCPVAHLYISPKRRIGEGNHSFVYQVELELPRTMLVPPKICLICARRRCDSEKIKREEMTPAELEKADSKNNENVDEQRECSKPFEGEEQFTECDRDDERNEMLERVELQRHPPFCEHVSNGVPASPSHRVSVTAKLSIPDDYHRAHSQHLLNEAAIYQSFPSHMFEHWNGYNMVPPIQDPTPVGAVVPQFYGFYVPDRKNEPIEAGEYMSPILLLENCGVQIDPSSLTLDERQECFSLLRRLHVAGYLHHSIYQRNILMQYGPLQESPFKRNEMHLRFRFIDFGRTVKCNPDVNEAHSQQSQEFQAANESLQLSYY